MKNAQLTLIELLRHIIGEHPELRPVIESILFDDYSLRPGDIRSILELNSHILSKSKSQNRQDIFVLTYLNKLKNGFFVEFGATSGVDISNTFLLETEYNWTGILAEPAKHWHEELHKNRNCHIETNCVWKSTDEIVLFNETENRDLSTIYDFSTSDQWASERKKGNIYEVKTISLLDLLKKYDAPKFIEYLSIDTEGSEFEILSNFDFSKYTFKVITCEHNYTNNRQKIYDLLTSKGYKRVFENISATDDWYVMIQ